MAKTFLKFDGNDGTIYTVPVGKVAKIVLNYMNIRDSNTPLTICNKTYALPTGKTENWSYYDYNGGNPYLYHPTYSHSISLGTGVQYPRDHFLVAGESISMVNTNVNTTIRFLVIEEDI